MTDVTSLLERAAAGDRSEEVLAWLFAGVAAFRRAEGEVPLERCLRLPTTELGVRRAERDQALRRAFSLIPGKTPRARCLQLETAWSRFESGRWRVWRYDAHPPSDATELERCLFAASKCSDGVLGLRSLQDICGEDAPRV